MTTEINPNEPVQNARDLNQDAPRVEDQSAPEPPAFGTDYDEAPNATEADANFDAEEQIDKEDS